MKISRSTREGTGTFLDVILIVGIFVLLQYLAYAHPHEWDFTPNQEYSLSELSKKVLASLKQDLDLWVFVARGDQRTRDLVHEYEVASSRVKVHFVDPNAEPLKAREFGVSAPPPILVAIYGKNREQISAPDESRVTNAIDRLVNGSVRTVYFLQGEGEPDLGSAEAEGYSSLRDALQSENFIVKPLPLIKEKKIPDDASAIVIADPRTSFFPKEKKWLSDYLKGGGRILFLCSIKTSPDGLAFLRSFGIDPQNDLVVDSSMQVIGGGPEFLVANNYSASSITQPFTENKTPTPVILPLARSLNSGPAPKGVTVSTLVSTSASGAAFPLKVVGNRAVIQFKKPSQKGVIPVALSAVIGSQKVGSPKKEGRLVAVGSSYFANNQWLNNYANRDFALNTLSWLTESTERIAIHPKPFKNPPLVVDRRAYLQLNILAMVALPGFGVILGVSNWLWRRSL